MAEPQPTLQIGPYWIEAVIAGKFKKACVIDSKSQREVIEMLITQYVGAVEKMSKKTGSY